MSTTHTTPQERTASLASHLTDALARSFTLGVDATGSTHHYYRPADAVVVFDGRELDHYQPLDGRPLVEWREFVAEDRGWDSTGQLAQLGLQADSERKGPRMSAREEVQMHLSQALSRTEDADILNDKTLIDSEPPADST